MRKCHVNGSPLILLHELYQSFIACLLLYFFMYDILHHNLEIFYDSTCLDNSHSIQCFR